MESPIKLFIIYAREDSAYKDRIIKQLRPLKGLIEEWHDGYILPGERWDEKISTQLRSADIILLLISDDFFDSEYIQNTEIKNAFSRYQLGEVSLMPVIVRECVWEVAKEISSLQVLPENGTAIASWQNQDAALRSVVKGVQIKAEQIQGENASKMASAQRQREDEDRQRLFAEEKSRRDAEAHQVAAQRTAEEEKQRRIASEQSQQRAEEQSREKQAWQATWTSNTIEAYEDYLNKFQPDPLFKKEAGQEIKRLKKASEPSIWVRHKQSMLAVGGLILLLLVGWMAISLFRSEKPSDSDVGKGTIKPNPIILPDTNKNQSNATPAQVEIPSTDEPMKPQTVTIEKPSAYLSLDKMNVFYIGVDNPVTVLANGISPSSVKVSALGVTISSQGGGRYTVRATTPGEGALIVGGGGMSSVTYRFRVRRMPDPLPMLGAKHRSKTMSNGEFKAQGGIAAILENFDFDAKCEIVGYEATYLPKRQDPISRQNDGARWSTDIQDWINKAKPGDFYFFDDIRCRCPGDASSRNIGGLAYKIK